MKIKFLETRLVKDDTGTTFVKDEVYDLSEASAKHWISRGVAVKAGPASKATVPKVETATVHPPETTQSRNVPLRRSPPAPLTTKDVRAMPL